MHCLYEKICSGCSWIEKPINEQIESKKQNFWTQWDQAHLPRPETSDFVLIDENGLRDRVDLVLDNGLLSLYQKGTRSTFAMESCPAMSPELESWFKDFKKLNIPITRGSLRLRVSPTGERAVWLDFANEDIKFLFEEKTALLNLFSAAYVEIGQRRKKLVNDGDRLRLKDPEYHLWTETSAAGNKIPLYSLVASFSQTGHRANQRLVQEIEKFANLSKAKTWVEFGAGTGNLTFPVSGGKRKVLALEYDELSLRGLEKTLASQTAFQSLITLGSGDYQKKKRIDFSNFEGILVNPPRSGLVNFLDPLNELEVNQRPKDFIYMSCYQDSFLIDSKNLVSSGYKPKQITLIDQFPQTPHCEILSYWSLS